MLSEHGKIELGSQVLVQISAQCEPWHTEVQVSLYVQESRDIQELDSEHHTQAVLFMHVVQLNALQLSS